MRKIHFVGLYCIIILQCTGQKTKQKNKKKVRKYLKSAVLQARSLSYTLDEFMTIFKTNTADVSI